MEKKMGNVTQDIENSMARFLHLGWNEVSVLRNIQKVLLKERKMKRIVSRYSLSLPMHNCHCRIWTTNEKYSKEYTWFSLRRCKFKTLKETVCKSTLNKFCQWSQNEIRWPRKKQYYKQLAYGHLEDNCGGLWSICTLCLWNSALGWQVDYLAWRRDPQ